MKHSPFAFFRKYQRIGMVALTVMAMFSFVFMDSFSGRGGGGNVRADQVAVKMAGGNLTASQLSDLRVKRAVVNDFIVSIIMKAYGAEENDKLSPQQLERYAGQNRFGIEFMNTAGGLDTDQNVIWGHIMRAEAKRLGQVVSDPMITSYIERMTEKKLTSEQFQEVLTALGLRQKQIYDMFRDEMLARNAYMILRPMSDPTPEQYWEYYRRMKVTQNLEVAALPVSEFAKQVKDPSESEQKAYFNQYKHRFAGQGPDFYIPGFRQPYKVRVQYLSATYEEVENKTAPVTDADIVAFYEKNKDTLYRELEKPTAPAGTNDADPLNPELAPEKAAAPATDKPTDEKPAEEKPAADKPAEEKPAEAKPAEEKPAAPEEKKAEEKPATEEKAGKSCEDQPAAAKEAATEEKPAEEKPAEAKPADAKPEAAKPAEDKPADAKPAEQKPTEEKPAVEKPAEVKPTADAAAKPEAVPVKYQPLTPELKKNISEELTRQRTQDALKDLASKAVQELEDRKLRYNMPVSVTGKKAYIDFNENGELDADEPFVESETALDPDALDKVPAAVTKELNEKLLKIAAADLKSVGKKLGMKFSETGLVSAQEIDEMPGLGKVIDEGDNPFQPSGSGSILNVLFGKEQLFSADMGKDSETLDTYVYWKSEQVKSHIPEFTDPGIKELVVAAWKLEQAYPIAVKRAEELAKLADKQKKLEVALKGQTVTTAKDSLPVQVLETADFSWLTPGVPGPNPLQAPEPIFSTVAFVENPGSEFMRVACDQLQIGETGVAPNRDHSIVYVARVINREPKPGEETERLRETFMKERLFGLMQFGIPSTYTYIAQDDAGLLYYDWLEDLKKKYDVSFVDEEKTF